MPSLFPGPQVVTLTTCARGGVGVRARGDVAEVTDSHQGYPRRSPRGGATCINAARPWSHPTTRYSSTHKVAAPNITHQDASFIIFCLGDYNLKSKGSVFLFYTSRKFIQKEIPRQTTYRGSTQGCGVWPSHATTVNFCTITSIIIISCITANLVFCP